MEENKRKHLEFIQIVITRMNSNSFLIKGWTVTLVSALFALAAKDADQNYVLISYIPIPVFWILDGFFISREKKYRTLYEDVRVKNDSLVDFSMDISNYTSAKNSWIAGIFSKTLIPFYGILIGTTIVVMFFITKS
jgi:hypothetical protein